MATNIPGVYAAGDIVTYPAKFKLIATGCAEAITAVNHAVTYFDPEGPPRRRPLHQHHGRARVTQHAATISRAAARTTSVGLIAGTLGAIGLLDGGGGGTWTDVLASFGLSDSTLGPGLCDPIRLRLPRSPLRRHRLKPGRARG